MASEPTATLRAWRVMSAVIVLLQTLVMLAVFALVFIINAGEAAAYVLATVMVVLEIADWSAARRALHDAPESYRDDAYLARPLSQAERRLVTFNLAAIVIGWAFLIAVVPMRSFRHDAAGGALVMTVVLGPAAIGMWRVRSRNSWRAVARIPAPPTPPSDRIPET